MEGSQDGRNGGEALDSDGERAERFRILAELSTDLLGLAGPDGVWRWASPASRALLGYAPEDLVGRDVLMSFAHTEDRDALRTWRARRQGQPPSFRLRRADGGYVWVEAHTRLLLLPDGSPREICFALRDISGRKGAEEAVRRSEARLHQLIGGLPEAIAVLRSGRVVFVNPAHVSWLGHERAEELVGRAYADFIHPDDRAAVAFDYRGPGSAPLRELRFLRRDGEVVTAEVAVQNLEFDGAPALLASARDVSERKRMHARLLQADRMVSVGTLAAGVAHEINNPLASVIANLEVVAEDLPKLAAEATSTDDGASGEAVTARVTEMEETLRDAREGAERVRLIVRDLRTLSRGDDDRRAPTDVKPVLESSVNMVGNEIRHRARLRKDYQDVPLVEANEARLGQVFINLLLNAAQAIPEGQADRNEIRVATRLEAGRVLVEVSDTGAGIASEIRARIFDPFFTTKPIGAGTGLGLSVCQSIIAGLGGEITCETAVGRGTVFRVWLPPAQRVPAARPLQITPRAVKARARVLVVDDEPMIGTSVRRSLGGEHDVTAVTSAHEALSLLTAGQRFDLILCDLMMPVMTGMDLYGEMQRGFADQAARTIFVTGGAFTPRAQEFLDHVDNPHIEKPFDLRQLRALVKERLRAPA